MAMLIFFLCSSSTMTLAFFLVAILSIMYARNSGSSHFFLNVSAIFFLASSELFCFLADDTFLARYSGSVAHRFFSDSRIFCFVSSECLNPFLRAPPFGLRFFTSPLAHFSFRTALIFALVSSVGLYPPFSVRRARRSASFFLRSSFFFCSYSSSVTPMSASFARNRSLFLFRTPSAMRRFTSSDRPFPLFHGTFPLLAAEILAFEALVWLYPPASVGRGTSAISSEKSASVLGTLATAPFVLVATPFTTASESKDVDAVMSPFKTVSGAGAEEALKSPFANVAPSLALPTACASFIVEADIDVRHLRFSDAFGECNSDDRGDATTLLCLRNADGCWGITKL
mmetsp:Transcript_60649/g.179848  ORF Transcript_60649/g.179848 Transcript_60649/m.179848 type:complete len:342 (-) Transcript_60649:528-1553(-)